MSLSNGFPCRPHRGNPPRYLAVSLKAGREQIRAYERFQATITAFSKLDLLPFDEEAARHFHRLQSARVRIGTKDLKIASICLATDATLLTRNLVDFEKVPGLRVENWLQ